MWFAIARKPFLCISLRMRDKQYFIMIIAILKKNVCVAYIQAANYGNWSCVEALAKAGAMDVPDEEGTTALMKVGTSTKPEFFCARTNSLIYYKWCMF